jgi:hypothetical protein
MKSILSIHLKYRKSSRHRNVLWTLFVPLSEGRSSAHFSFWKTRSPEGNLDIKAVSFPQATWRLRQLHFTAMYAAPYFHCHVCPYLNENLPHRCTGRAVDADLSYWCPKWLRPTTFEFFRRRLRIILLNDL